MSDDLANAKLPELSAAFIWGRAQVLREHGTEFFAASQQARAEWGRMLSLLGRPAEPEAPFNPLTSPVVLLDVSAGRPESEWQKDLYTHARLGYRFAGTIKAHTGDYVVMQVPEDR